MRRVLRNWITGISNRALDIITGFLTSSHPEWNPRAWSNREIRRFGTLYAGDIINVSAAEDRDKERGQYSDYFPNARSYSISNYGTGAEGSSGRSDEKLLDLSAPYDGGIGEYDLVLSHTVIEHIYPLGTALDSLCRLSRDSVMTVVPFLMGLHGREESYDDFWRCSPFALEKAFESRGFKTLYMSWSDGHPLMNVYLFHVASRYPERYSGKFPETTRPAVNIHGPGVSFSSLIWGRGGESGRTVWRRAGEFVGCRIVPPAQEMRGDVRDGR